MFISRILGFGGGRPPGPPPPPPMGLVYPLGGGIAVLPDDRGAPEAVVPAERGVAGAVVPAQQGLVASVLGGIWGALPNLHHTETGRVRLPDGRETRALYVREHVGGRVIERMYTEAENPDVFIARDERRAMDRARRHERRDDERRAMRLVADRGAAL